MTKGSPLIIVVAVMASLLEIIDTSIVNVALPTMMGNLGATLEDISMVVTGYAIANAIVLPASAWLSERIGRRKYFLGCILAFTLISVACGLAPNLFFLTIFRIAQGAMGGALLPTSQTLIYEQFPKEKAGMAGAIFGMSVMIGPTLGPVLGGYLTDEFGWRSIFNINLPLGLLCFFIGYSVIFDREEEGQKAAKQDLDAIGLALLILGVGCLQFVLERGEANDWFSSGMIVANTAISLICIPSFIWWELKTKNPIINVRLFKDQIVTNGVLLMALLGFFLYSLVFILPIFLTRSFHYTATQTGAFFIPGSLLTAFCMPFVGQAMTRGISSKLLIAFGLSMVEVCLYMATQFSPLSDSSHILHMLYVRGLAMAFLFVPINSSILAQFKGQNLAQVSGLMNLSRQIGGSIGIAMVATLLTTRGHQNYLDVTSSVSLLNPATQANYYPMLSSFAHKAGVGMGSAHMAALSSLFGRIQAQVFMMSFIQLTWIVMFIFALAFIPLYRLRLRFQPSGPVDAH
jgi:DHA2 family multidrug resistance protein